MGGDRQHVCSATAFAPFPESVLDRSIVDRFAEQVALHRDCVALVDRDRRLTYGALDAWANGVAHAIAECGGERRDPVAVVVGQGATYAAAVLGTLKSGRPYVPLDPADPVRRVADFIAQCGARIVVSDAESGALAWSAAGHAQVLQVDATAPRDTAPDVEIAPDDIAYIFFTSGSTGAPKGVYDSHRNVLHNVLRYTNALEIAPSDRLTLLQGPAFSGCVSSQLGALLNGAASYPFRLREDGLVRAAEWLRRERITMYHSLPSIFRAVVAAGEELPDVRVVRLEGDRATSDDVELWKRHFGPGCVLANGLGTTETGLARQLVIRADDAVSDGVLPVGYATRDMEAFVVDDEHALLPRGAIGEIAIASRYLALGYWKQPDLTAERFITIDGSRAYLTGDLGRLRADGCLEFLGRRDGGLKVLGNRVEPAEIEGELIRLDGIRDVAVVVREGRRGDGRITAYVVPETPGTFFLEALRSSLAEALPSYMLPSSLMELAALPVGSNGKFDPDALPDVPDAGLPMQVHLRADEEWLAEVWADVLEVASVSADDDFFALGGDSLAAAEIVARIELETGRSLPLGVLVRAPTLAQLAAVLETHDATLSSSLTVLREGTAGVPLVLLHGNTGNTLHYAQLVPQLDGGRPIWAFEYLEENADLRVDAIVAAHRVALATAQPEGPYVLAGFCYGAVIAHELGRQLAQDGHDVQVALLGITPLEFPTVLPPADYERWSRVHGPSAKLGARVRYHAGLASQRPLRQVPSYLAQRCRNVAVRNWRRLGERTTQPPRSGNAAGAQLALASHRPAPFPGRPLVVLHRDDTALLTNRPEDAWAGLGADGVDVHVVPGGDHALLEDPGVVDLARMLDAWAASAAADPR